MRKFGADLFEFLHPKAFFVVMQVNGVDAGSKPRLPIVKNALVKLAQTLENDDIGYLWQPNSDRLSMLAGEFVGQIANCNLPFSFNFGNAVESTVRLLESIDPNYQKSLYLISDCYEKVNNVCVNHALKRAKKFCNIGVWTIGDSCEPLQSITESNAGVYQNITNLPMYNFDF